MGRGFVDHAMTMKILASTTEVLATLKANREKHSKIVKEAREGYVVKAREALEKKLEEIRTGKIVALSFNLSPPVSYKAAYDTAIQMLEIHTEDVIELTGTEVRHLLMDEWDWSTQFLTSNSAYSQLARDSISPEED